MGGRAASPSIAHNAQNSPTADKTRTTAQIIVAAHRDDTQRPPMTDRARCAAHTAPISRAPLCAASLGAYSHMSAWLTDERPNSRTAR